MNQLNLKHLQDAMDGKAQSVPQEIYQGLDMVLRYAATLWYEIYFWVPNNCRPPPIYFLKIFQPGHSY